MLYLPVSATQVDALLAGTDPQSTLDGLTPLGRPEVAALLVIQKLGAVQDPAATAGLTARLERMLSDFIAALNALPDAHYRDRLVHLLDRRALAEGRQRLAHCPVSLMGRDEVADRAYLDRSGAWVWNYVSPNHAERFPNPVIDQRASRQHRFTDEQNRVLNAFHRHPDESMDISGYAGCGKTRLIAQLPDFISSDEALYLAMYDGQRAGMARRLGTAAVTGTFAGLARRVLQTEGLLGTDSVTMDRIGRRFEARPEELVQVLEIAPLATLSAEEVARAAMTMVTKYCFSDHPGIWLKDLPKRYEYLEKPDQQAIQDCARQLWSLTQAASGNEWLPLKDYHLIKLMALSKAPIPADFRPLVIDEAHDLPPAVVQLIDRGDQAVITFGDRYQALRGQRAARQRARHVLSREMSHSVRAGHDIADTVNRICAYHPSGYMAPFEGSRDRQTRLSRYRELSIPEAPCTLLSNSGFQLFSVMQRLAVAGSRFFIFQRDDLEHLIRDTIDLFVDQRRATHRDLRRYPSWEQLMESRSDPVLEKVGRLLRGGYRGADLATSLAKAQTHYRPEAYALGRIEDVKNMEFSRVLLLPDVLDINGIGSEAIADYVNHIYTGLSRAKDEVIVPQDFEDRIAAAVSSATPQR